MHFKGNLLNLYSSWDLAVTMQFGKNILQKMRYKQYTYW
jgi:hypothetical protein